MTQLLNEETNCLPAPRETQLAVVAGAIVAADQKVDLAIKPWLRHAVARYAGGLCEFCGASTPRDEGRTSMIVPGALGGWKASDNVAWCCKPCQVDRANRDLVAWSPASRDEGTWAKLLAKRDTMLINSGNHLTPHRRYAPADKVLAHLRARWVHPRFRAFAIHSEPRSWIGWVDQGRKDEGVATAAGLLQFAFGGTSHQEGGAVIFSLDPDRFQEAVWALIEHHGLIQRLENSGLLLRWTAQDRFEDFWWRQYPSLGALRRRAQYLPLARYGRSAGSGYVEPSAPGPTREPSTNPATVRSRRRHARNAEQSKAQAADRTLDRMRGKLGRLEAYEDGVDPARIKRLRREILQAEIEQIKRRRH